YAISASIGLAGGDRYLGHGGFAQRVQQLGAVGDNGVPLLVRAWQKARYVYQHQQGNIKGVAEAGKASAFYRGMYIQHAGQVGRLVGYNPDAAAAQQGKAYNDVLRKIAVHLKEAVRIR